jgi:hypothetical protein
MILAKRFDAIIDISLSIPTAIPLESSVAP